MNQTQEDILKAFARHLYVQMAQFAGPGFWDWQTLANRAFDAAEQFEVVAIQRIEPQKAVPKEQVPGAVAATDPAVAAQVMAIDPGPVFAPAPPPPPMPPGFEPLPPVST